jgi:hypothetical protein
MAAYRDHLQTALKLVTEYSVTHGRKISRPTMIKDVTTHVPRNVCKMITKIA